MFGQIKKYIPNIYKRNASRLIKNCFQSFRYYLLDGRLSGKALKRPACIIFICKGNVCRSPFAEQRLKSLRGQNVATVDSCGLDVNQGNFPPPDSVAVAGEFSCQLKNRPAKGLKECDLENADLILAMEYEHYQKLLALYPHKKDAIHLLRSFAPFPDRLFCNIDDPYGWGPDEYRRTFRLIDKSLQRFI